MELPCPGVLLLAVLGLLLARPAAAQQPTIKELRARFEGMSREQRIGIAEPLDYRS